MTTKISHWIKTSYRNSSWENPVHFFLVLVCLAPFHTHSSNNKWKPTLINSKTNANCWLCYCLLCRFYHPHIFAHVLSLHAHANLTYGNQFTLYQRAFVFSTFFLCFDNFENWFSLSPLLPIEIWVQKLSVMVLIAFNASSKWSSAQFGSLGV